MANAGERWRTTDARCLYTANSGERPRTVADGTKVALKTTKVQAFGGSNPSPSARPLSPQTNRRLCRWPLLGPSAGLDQTALIGQHDRLHPVSQLELHKKIPDVTLDGCLSEVQLCRDLGIAQTARHEVQHLGLPSTQPIELSLSFRGDARHPHKGFDQTPGDGGRQQRFACGHHVNGGDQLLGWRVLEQKAAGACLERLEDV